MMKTLANKTGQVWSWKAQGVLHAQTLVRTNKRLNNLIEQDHRKAPQRCYPMLGFKTFGNAVNLRGVGALAQNIPVRQIAEGKSQLVICTIYLIIKKHRT
jgi:hypothetical protein